MKTESAKKECQLFGLEDIKLIGWHNLHFGEFILVDVNPKKGYRFEYQGDKRVKYWVSEERYKQLKEERNFKTGLARH